MEQKVLELEAQVAKITLALNNMAKQLEIQQRFNADIIAALQKLNRE